MPPIAVILAAGRGTRLRAEAPETAAPTPLSAMQQRAADSGIKALMPIRKVDTNGSVQSIPFIQFSLEALAAAGLERVCFVIRPDVEATHTLFPCHSALELSFVVQEQARGTADAVRSAEAAVGQSDFLVLNSDTYYPASLLRALVQTPGPALVALDGYAVAEERASNLTATQMASWATIAVDANGDLAEVLPPPKLPPEPPWWVNINAWRFDTTIFEACHSLAGHSADGGAELELPRAVQWSRSERGLRYRVVHSCAPILDLTSRADVPALERLLPTLKLQAAAPLTHPTPLF